MDYQTKIVEKTKLLIDSADALEKKLCDSMSPEENYELWCEPIREKLNELRSFTEEIQTTACYGANPDRIIGEIVRLTGSQDFFSMSVYFTPIKKTCGEILDLARRWKDGLVGGKK